MDVAHHAQVTLHELYPGVALDLRIAGQALKYDIVADHPRQLEQVRIRYSGHDALEVRGDELLIRMGDDELVEHIPASWIGSERTPVKVVYTLIEQAQGHAVLGLHVVSGVEAGRSGRLVVDPAVNFHWGTYHGGELAEAALAVAMDKHGFTFVAGRTAGAPTFVTTGADQDVHAGGASDAFVSRIAPQGSRIWTTYYGGEGDDEALAVSVDDRFYMRLAGRTTSTQGMATDSTGQMALVGGGDAFLALFDTSGHRVWGTYLGGSAEEAITDVFAFPDGRSCVCGRTTSADLFDSVAVAPAQAYAGATDGFVVCFNASGFPDRATFLGGDGDDELNALVLKADSTLHAVGSTTGALPFSSDTAHGGTDAIYLALDTGFQILHASLFGGSGDDAFLDVALEDSAVVVCGHTRSAGLALNAINSDTLGGMDALLVRYISDTLLGATYLGGPGDDRAVSLFHDAQGWTFVGGSSVHYVVDTLMSPIDTIPKGLDAVVYMLLGTDSIAVQRYFGGTADEVVGGMAMYGLSTLSIVGGTWSTEGIAWEGFQPSHGGDEDVFVRNFETDRSTPCIGISQDEPNGPCSGGGSPWWNSSGGGGPWEPEPEPFMVVCLGDSVTLCTSGGYLCSGHYWMWYHTECGNPVHFMEIGPCVTFFPTQNITVYVRSEGVEHEGYCTKLNIVVDEYPDAVASAPVLVCQGDSIPLTGTGGVMWNWAGPGEYAAAGEVVNAPSDTLQGEVSFVLTASSQYGCLDHDTVNVMVQAVPLIQPTIVDPACHGGAQGSITMTTDTLPGAELSYSWPALGLTTAVVDSLPAGTYVVVISDTLGCQRADSIVLQQPPHPLDTVLVQTATCGAANGSMEVVLLPGAGPHFFTWDSLPGDSSFLDGLSAGTYSATFMHPAGCTYQVMATVGDTGTFAIELIATPTTIMLGDSTWLEATVTPEQPGAILVWNPAFSVTCDTCLATYATPTSDVTYSVQITSMLGCISSDSVAVTVEIPPVPAFFLPSHFSPNGDGLNDLFHPLGGAYTKLRLVITSPTGQEVLVAEGTQPAWDGRIQGVPAPVGPYHVLVEASRPDGGMDVFDHQLTLLR